MEKMCLRKREARSVFLFSSLSFANYSMCGFLVSQRKSVYSVYKSPAKATGLKSRVASVFSIDEHMRPQTCLSAPERGECRPQQAAHTLQSYFNL